MHHDEPLACRIDYTKNNNQTNSQQSFIIQYMVVSLMCLIVVLVGLPLLTIYAFQHDAFAGPCALINLILYCRNRTKRYRWIRIDELYLIISTSEVTAEMWSHMGWFMVTLRKIARPLSAVNGLWTNPVMQRMVYSELLSSYIVPEASGHPTVTFPIIPFDQSHKISPLKWRSALCII
jgi:hypothetical protein